MESHSVASLFLALGIIIAASRLSGALARKLGQPRVLGELLVGVILGPTLLDLLHAPMLHGVELGQTVKSLADFGVVLLMFLIGLEVHLSELVKVGHVAVFAGVLGALTPVLLTLPVGLLSGYQWQPVLFAGVALAATSVSISAQVLFELGVLRTKEGTALLATALIDDVLAILLVSFTIAVASPASAAGGDSLLVIALRIGLYIAGAFVVAWFVLPRVLDWLADQPPLAQSSGVPAAALIAVLLFAWSAESVGGVAAITGAFLAGLGMSRARERVKREIQLAVEAIAYAFLVPIFFVDIGLEIDLSAFPLSALPFAALLLAIAVVSKIGGCGVGARLGGFSRVEALRLGVCMVSRGEVGLIVASLGLSVGVFTADTPMFASLFLVIVMSTVLTPALVRQMFHHPAVREVSKTEVRS